MRRTSRWLGCLCFGLSVAGCPADTTSPEGDAGADAHASDGGDAGHAIDAGPCERDRDCDDGVYCNGDETCTGGTCHAGTARTCDDGIACTVDSCVESTRGCRSALVDHDGDGFGDMSCHDALGVPLGTDCNDDDANDHPGGTEVCDPSHDEDCNPATFGVVDMDGDGYPDARCCNTGGLCGTDCDDTMSSVNPGVNEVCNGVDDDCDTHMDEGLPIQAFLPDCDLDGYGDTTATPVMACAAPMIATSCAGGRWVTMPGDCADDDMNRHVGATEACNDIDDDCDTFVDDIIHGNVVCHAGQTEACTTACNVSGMHACSGTCLGYDATCIATEVCNGCDDDADGTVDDGFACARGTSENCTVPTCGSSGTRVCSSSCGWGACTASEVCNYCDDNGNGNFFEERSQASVTSSDHFLDCSSNIFGPGTDCGPDHQTSSSQDLYATLLDGMSNDQAGALWLTPSNWTMGWGPIDVTIQMEVTAQGINPANAEIPLGGWSIIVGRGGTVGVGAPSANGVPSGGPSGLQANYYWSNYETCMFPNYYPASNDAFRFGAHRRVGGSSGDTCTTGINVLGGSPQLDGEASGTITQTMTLHYVPDDPTTAAVNEEAASITAGAVGNTITYNFETSNELPLASGPLRIGITAGTYTRSGFSNAPGQTFGVPVLARVRLWTQHYPQFGQPNYYDYYANITRAQICP